MINGERIRQVRELLRLTQTEFADMIGVNQSAVAQIESGRITPSEDVLNEIVKQTGFPQSFFELCSSTDFPLESLSFRARSSVPQKQISEARQYARTVFEMAEQMEKGVQGLEIRLPQRQNDPVAAALQTRFEFGLSSDDPVQNLSEVIERNGVLMIALPVELEKIDAFSGWIGNEETRPVIAVTRISASAGDRLRFSLAHELGHIVLHRSVTVKIADYEKEANLFAGEFLMPREAMLKELPPVTLINLQRLKSRWKVSIQALVRRAHELELITLRHYKYLMFQISNRGWRKNEPVSIPVEKPRKIGQLAESWFGTPVDYQQMAKAINLPFRLVQQVVEAHAIRTVSKAGPAKIPESNILRFPRNKHR